MKKLYPIQKKILATLIIKKERKKLKKAFIECNKECEIEDAKLLFQDFFNVITNPLFLEIVKNTKI